MTTYDTTNRHLVAIDVTSAGSTPRICVAMPPRTSMTREQALMFAAWLVTTADASQSRGFDHEEIAELVSNVRELRGDGEFIEVEPNVYLDTADGITIRKPDMFLSPSQCRGLAADLVALALPDDDVTQFFECVAAVHGVVQDGSALDFALKDDRAVSVDLKAPVRHRLSPAAPNVSLRDDEVEQDSASAVRKRGLKP